MRYSTPLLLLITQGLQQGPKHDCNMGKVLLSYASDLKEQINGTEWD